MEDLTGQKYGRLTVLNNNYIIKNKKTYLQCQCECGTIKYIRKDQLKNGHTFSCGCYKIEQNKKNLSRATHLLSKTRLYKIYYGIKKRCYNPNCKNYNLYGKRGIKLSPEWENNFISFYNWAIENGYKDNLTIDRIDVNSDYSPKNCRWASYKTQQNNKRNNHNIKYNNKTQNLMLWCMELDLDYFTVIQRINKLKWSIKRAFETPTNGGYHELR